MNNFEERLFIESLYDTYSLNVKAMAKYILKDEKLAAKAVDRTFTKVILSRNLLRQVEVDEIGKLVVVFLRCSCFELLRGKNRIKYDSKFETPKSYNNYGAWNKILKKSTLCWLKNTYISFGSPFKEICILRFYYNMDIKAVARALGMNRLDVYAVLIRRLAKLKNETESFIGESVTNEEMGLALSLVSGEYACDEFSRMENFDVSKVTVSSKTKEKVLRKLKFAKAKPFLLLGVAAVVLLAILLTVLIFIV